MMKELQFYFPRPGKWGEFELTAIYPDADGYTRTDHYTAEEIPADQAPALAAAVTAIASMGEDWQASQVWARLDMVVVSTPAEDGEDVVETIEAVVLTVEAVNAHGGRKLFTSADYPEFTITEAAAVAFFKHFSGEDERV